MGIGYCRWTVVHRWKQRNRALLLCNIIFKTVRTSLGATITNSLEFFLCIYLHSLHFDKQDQIEYLNNLVTLDVSTNPKLVKCPFNKLSAIHIYQMAIVSSLCTFILILILTLKVDVVLVMCSLHWWVVVDLAFVYAQQLGCFFFKLRH